MKTRLNILIFLLTISILVIPVVALNDSWEGYVPIPITGTSPLTVNFTDVSYNSPTAWNWSFKNVTGNNIEVWFSQARNTSYTFTTGNYSIRLNSSNVDGFNITPVLAFVNVSAGGGVSVPAANFTATPLSGNYPLTVQFNDTSTNTPTSWGWCFNEVCLDYISTLQNPSYTFSLPGNYTVSLVASNSAGSDIESKSQYIYVTSGPDTTPPANVTSLTSTSYTNTSLLWGWVKPGDYDLNLYMIYKNGIWFQNLTGSATALNWTGLTPSTEYTIGIRTVDNSGNANSYKVNATASTSPLPEGSGGLIGLTNSVPGSNSVRWSWSNPIYPNYSHVMIWKNGIWFQNLSSSYTAINWTGLEGGTSYTFSSRTVSSTEIVNETWVNRTITTQNTSWIFTTPGYSYWTCPADITQVFLNIGAGGGGGRASFTRAQELIYGYPELTYLNYSGLGGTAGEWKNLSPVTVVPGTTYTLFVGSGGARQSSIYGYYPLIEHPVITGNPGTNSGVSNDGGVNWQYLAIGGLGGAGNAPTDNGGNGIGNGFMTTAKLAEDGLNSNGGTGPFLGGIATTGYSGAGGGGAKDESRLAYGGKGADGYIGIADITSSISNYPNFSADVTSCQPGSLIHFTDLSTIKTSTNLTYLWDFGDGLTSNTTGSVAHVYSYTGVYDVSLTLTADSGTITEVKTAYIIVTTQQYYSSKPVYNSHLVRFRAVDYTGKSLVNMNVTAVVVESTSPYSWITDVIGIDLGSIAILNTTMQGQTGTDGSVVFMMVETLKYKVDFVDTTTSVNETIYVYPKEDNYVHTFWTETATAASTDSITITFWNATNSTNPLYMDLGAKYVDTGSSTNRLTFTVRKDLNSTFPTVTGNSSTPNNWNVSYPVLKSGSGAYIWGMSGNSTRFALPVQKYQVYQLRSEPVIPFTLGTEWNRNVALAFIFVIALLIGRVSIKYGAAIVPLLTLFFWAIEFLSFSWLMMSSIVFLGIVFYIRYSEQESDI